MIPTCCINRHVLLHYMPQLYNNVNKGGKLLLSGILVEDKAIISDSAVGAGFSVVTSRDLNNWSAMLFEKK